MEDLHEALAGTVPGIAFGLAFCESSGACLVCWSGTDREMIGLAQKNALSLSAGHSFIIFLKAGFFPVNVLNAVKMIPEVCRIYCATANPVEVLIGESAQGRGILGVIDGLPTRGIEGINGQMKIQVECYAGYRGEETPRRLADTFMIRDCHNLVLRSDSIRGRPG